jgi:hypothetical protein
MANEESLPIKIPDVLFQYCGGNAVEIFEKRRINLQSHPRLTIPLNGSHLSMKT